MAILSPDTLRLAERLAAGQGIPLEEAVKRAIEHSARTAGLVGEPQRRRRRQTAAEMLVLGAEIAAMPLLDRRSPRAIMDDLDTP